MYLHDTRHLTPEQKILVLLLVCHLSRLHMGHPSPHMLLREEHNWGEQRDDLSMNHAHACAGEA